MTGGSKPDVFDHICLKMHSEMLLEYPLQRVYLTWNVVVCHKIFLFDYTTNKLDIITKLGNRITRRDLCVYKLQKSCCISGAPSPTPGLFSMQSIV